MTRRQLVQPKKLSNRAPVLLGSTFILITQTCLKVSTYLKKPNCVDVFCDYLIDLEARLKKLLNTNKPLVMTDSDEKEFQETKTCSFCMKPFRIDKKVRDHDHFSGKYRGAAHENCNLNEKFGKFVPIFFHNLSNYDAHLFIKQLINKLSQKQKTTI